MNLIAFFVFSLFTLALISKDVTAAPLVNSKTNYYIVSGKTASEIRSNLDRKTPIHESGTSYDAHTDWFIKWNYRWNESGELCTITTVGTEVDVQFTLPKLNASITFPKELKKKWEVYLIALLRHENGHKNISLRAAHAIEKKILNMASRRTCKQLEIDANHIGNKVLKKFRTIEKEYDRKSNHGINEGAVFP